MMTLSVMKVMLRSLSLEVIIPPHLGLPKYAQETFSSSSVFILFPEKTILGALPLPLIPVIHAH